MSLFRITLVTPVKPGKPTVEMIAELCKVLGETQRRLMEVNNECVELRKEVNALKKKCQ